MALAQGIVAQAAEGNTEGSLTYFEMLNDPDLTMEEVVIKFHEEQKKLAAEAAQGAQGPEVAPGGDPLAALTGAESLQRGGIPGQAEGLPAGAAMPGLSGIMAPDAPKQVG